MGFIKRTYIYAEYNDINIIDYYYINKESCLLNGILPRVSALRVPRSRRAGSAGAKRPPLPVLIPIMYNVHSFSHFWHLQNHIHTFWTHFLYL